jgi:CRISPR-associated endonuclease/helicase Cas3
VKAALGSEGVCRVVSTQLVEAGVDLDFPVVFRAMAGLDSLAQAAGRCNRNGILADEQGRPRRGRFIVFRAESSPPRGVLQRGFEIAESILAGSGTVDLSDINVMEEYFRALYLNSPLDRRGVMAQRREYNFATVGRLVRFIEEGMHPIVVPYGEALVHARSFSDAIDRTPGRARAAARRLQPFVVQVREWELKGLLRQGSVAPLDGFGHILSAPFLHLYDERFGLSRDAEAAADVNALIV